MEQNNVSVTLLPEDKICITNFPRLFESTATLFCCNHELAVSISEMKLIEQWQCSAITTARLH
jgi:hypothetical protein